MASRAAVTGVTGARGRTVRDNHRGAVALSRGEVGRGLNLSARELARGLVKMQEADLRELERLLDD